MSVKEKNTQLCFFGAEVKIIHFSVIEDMGALEKNLSVPKTPLRRSLANWKVFFSAFLKNVRRTNWYTRYMLPKQKLISHPQLRNKHCHKRIHDKTNYHKLKTLPKEEVQLENYRDKYQNKHQAVVYNYIDQYYGQHS